jgi:hypothetical protein
MAKIDSDLLALAAGLGAQLMNIASCHLPSHHHP